MSANSNHPNEAKKGPVHGTGSQLYSLSNTVLDVVHDELKELVDSSKARCAMVLDRTGCIMASAGDFHPVNPDNLGATAAATIAALNSMVSRASSPEVSVTFYDSDIDQIHFMVLEQRLVLCLLHSKTATKGSIRAVAREFADKVAKAVDEDKRNSKGEQQDLRKSVNYIESKLDQLFSDQLGLPKDPSKK